MGDVVIFDTEEMKILMNKVRPYLDEHLQLPDDVPEEIKEALSEYQRLGSEQMEYAYSLE